MTQEETAVERIARVRAAHEDAQRNCPHPDGALFVEGYLLGLEHGANQSLLQDQHLHRETSLRRSAATIKK